jgi:hypothetical protein
LSWYAHTHIYFIVRELKTLLVEIALLVVLSLHEYFLTSTKDCTDIQHFERAEGEALLHQHDIDIMSSRLL